MLGLLLLGGAMLPVGFSFFTPAPAAAESPATLAASLAEPLASSAPRLRELSELRTETSKTYELADGKREVVL